MSDTRSRAATQQDLALAEALRAGDETAFMMLVELVTEYLEGSMPAEQRARFEEHVSGCDGCTTYLEQFRMTIRLTGMLSEEQVAPDARETLLGVFRDWRKSA